MSELSSLVIAQLSHTLRLVSAYAGSAVERLQSLRIPASCSELQTVALEILDCWPLLLAAAVGLWLLTAAFRVCFGDSRLRPSKPPVSAERLGPRGTLPCARNVQQMRERAA